MIDFYTWSTPNGRKVSILLEELGVPYTVHPINIETGEQFSDAFLKVGPNGKIPVITDRETGISLMESGAIMVYLAEKYGKFIAQDVAGRARVLEWLMWQMGGFGPMAGQAHHFLRYNRDKSPYAEVRYGTEIARLYGVLDRRLTGREYVAGDYSIADMAIWPWAARHEWQEVDLADFPAVYAWYKRLAARPAVRRGYNIPNDSGPIPGV